MAHVDGAKIVLERIRRVYVTEDMETTALDDVSLTIRDGEFVAVMGPSGCGKSTLLNVLGMIDRPDGGRYLFRGSDVAGLRERALVTLRRAHLGFVFQSFNLIDDLSVEDNVALPLRYARVPGHLHGTRVREALELVGLNHRARHRPAQLSGGQQQRVAIARAVVNTPDVILADEPAGNLDTQNGHDVLDLLETLNQQNTTILMVTHSRDHAARAGRIVHMRDGRVIGDEGTSDA